MLKKEKRERHFTINIKLIGTVVPIILLMIYISFFFAGNRILALSKDKLSLETGNYAQYISSWAERILNELDIYKCIFTQMGLKEEEAYAALGTSYGMHEEYPYGLYWGDEKGNYYDSSGWVPGEDFVVTERDWYKEGLEHEEFAFGEPYVDAMTGDTCASVTVRLDFGSGVSVLAADVYLDYAAKLVSEITEGNIDSAFFVTAKDRIVLADSNASMVGVSLKEEGVSRLYQNVNELLDCGTVGQSRVKTENGTFYVDINWIENTDWYLVTCINEGKVLKELHRVAALMAGVAIVAALALSLVTMSVAKEMSEFKKKAKTDPLTRLLNRDGFREMMLLALETNSAQGILLIMDMDNFKQVNDQLGHPAGDEVLKRFSELLEGYFNRNKDIVARIGGDEFAVFVGRKIESPEVEQMLKKFISLFHETFDAVYTEQKLSVSIGGAFTAQAGEFETLYQNADSALYEVKRRGKNGYHIS